MVNSSGGRSEGHVSVRLPLALKRQLDAEIGRNGRTLSAEIVARLEMTFPSAPASTALPGGELEKRLALIEEVLREFGTKDWFLDAFDKPAQLYLQALVKRLPNY